MGGDRRPERGRSAAKFRLFKGTECDILADGSLDFPDDLLDGFDYVVASVHSQFGLPREEMTRRIVRAVSNPRVTMLGHPTGRLLLARDGYAVDLDAVIDAAAEAGTMIEINANPHRLDLDAVALPPRPGAGRDDRHQPRRPLDRRPGRPRLRGRGRPPRGPRAGRRLQHRPAPDRRQGPGGPPQGASLREKARRVPVGRMREGPQPSELRASCATRPWVSSVAARAVKRGSASRPAISAPSRPVPGPCNSLCPGTVGRGGPARRGSRRGASRRAGRRRRGIPAGSGIATGPGSQPIADRVGGAGQQDIAPLLLEQDDPLLEDLGPGDVEEGHGRHVEDHAAIALEPVRIWRRWKPEAKKSGPSTSITITSSHRSPLPPASSPSPLAGLMG